jgi:SAM-dependent methyltransferase
MVFHHFDDPEQAVRECRRVLRRDGTVCLRAGTADRVGETPYLPFFVRSSAILYTAFHSQAAIEAIFIDAGFQLAAMSSFVMKWQGIGRPMPTGSLSALTRFLCSFPIRNSRRGSPRFVGMR